MSVRKRFFVYFIGIFLLLSCLGSSAAQSSMVPGDEPLASVSAGTRGLHFKPKVRYSALVLTVSKPDGSQFQQTFEGGTPIFQLSGDDMDGSYTYELKFIPRMERKSRKEIEEKRKSSFSLDKEEEGKRGQYPKPMVQTGYFQVKAGRIVSGGGFEDSSTPPDRFTVQDIVHADDVIIDGSLAVGNDAYSGLAFGFDTIALMENNLRIFFDDTSTIQTYPRNDWRILINDTTDGGGNYFAIEDSTELEKIFTLEAGAPANSLYVDSYGDVGINTSTPYYELHIVDGDSPCVRLDQDGSYGWTPQKWDLCGNESNFFIRDATHASKLPFRIEPDAPTDSVFIKSNGRVGFGTGSPAYAMELERTGENAAFVLQRTSGATNYINATASYGNFGTVSNHPLRLAVNSVWRMRLNANNSLTMANGATCTAGGSWVDSSSREVKENISSLSTEEAMDTLEDLVPVKFNYKVDKQEKHVGFIAEDVPELVATNNRKGMSPMDVVAVLTKVVKEQQDTIAQLQERISELERRDRIKN
jgi:hypothetical protein